MSELQSIKNRFGIIGNAPALNFALQVAEQVASTDLTVLINGESGVGKEVFSQIIHHLSARKHNPFIAVNCGAIPEGTIDSELFGHEKGSFTGAVDARKGYFEAVNGGTIFLDEVGEIPAATQVKLLRVLQERTFERVGGNEAIEVDVRLVAATNRDLAKDVQDGRFREDLYYRLSVFELYIPPLRDRGSDIELLANHFLEHFKRQHGRPGLSLSPDAREKLLGYSWPGNVRQLRNVIDSVVVMCEGNVILPDDLGLRDTGGASDQLESLRVDFWERKLIQEALKRTVGSIPDAAKLLGLGRATLYRKVEEYGIERK